MNSVRTTYHVTGWAAVGAFVTVVITKTLTALVLSFPITWLVRQVFGGVPLRFLFGADGFSYWRCVGLFLIGFVGRVKIKFSDQALFEIDGDR